MSQKIIHIGHAIQNRLLDLKITKSEFGRLIGVPQQNINRILEKDTIDTGKLILISNVLKCNFFELFCDDKSTIINGNSNQLNEMGAHSNINSMGDAVLLERVKALETLLVEKDERINELKERIEELKAK